MTRKELKNGWKWTFTIWYITYKYFLNMKTCLIARKSAEAAKPKD